jgi:hypothetical protein
MRKGETAELSAAGGVKYQWSNAGGRILYTIRNYANNWDGRLNGVQLDEGTYYYVFEFDKPGILPKKGFITIVH